jgi:cysteine desulfuration protein SufE
MFRSLDEVLAEWEAIGELYPDPYDERMKLLVRLGEALEPMPDIYKTDATKVQGCATPVWLYAPNPTPDRLHFLADGAPGPGLTKGIIALILLAVQDRSAAEILDTDIRSLLQPFDIDRQFSSIRTSGLANMIEKVGETARRLAG